MNKKTFASGIIPKRYRYLVDIIWAASFFIGIGLLLLYFAINISSAWEIAFRNINAYIPTLIAILFIFFATRLILMIIKPLFMALVKVKIITHGDMKVIFQIFSSAIWALSLIIAFYAVVGSVKDLGLTVGLFSAAMMFVLGKPFLNVIGWMIIIFRRPFKPGDRIHLNYDGNEVEGDVVEVSMFYTHIRESGAWLRGDELTGRIITVPNATLLDRPLFNYSKISPFIWDRLSLTITYDSDHQEAKKILLKGARIAMKRAGSNNVNEFNQGLELDDLRSHILEGPEVEFQLADSGITLELLYLVHCRKRGQMESFITEYILDRFSRTDNVYLAYPHMAFVHGHDALRVSKVSDPKMLKRKTTTVEEDPDILSRFSGLISDRISSRMTRGPAMSNGKKRTNRGKRKDTGKEKG